MAEIMGTVTSIKRYLSPEKIELKISPDMGPENTIILPQNRRYIIPDFQREIRWEENNLSILLSDLSSSPRFLGNIILTIERNGNCQIIDGQQRTTILLLIIAYIKSRYQEQLEPFTPCLIENRSFIGLSELMNNGFDNSLLEKPEIIKTDFSSSSLLSGTPFLINSSMHLKSLLLGVASNFPRKSMEREISILSFPFSTNRER